MKDPPAFITQNFTVQQWFPTSSPFVHQHHKQLTIEGATRGIGLALAERLAQTPGNVIYAGARSLESASRLEKAAEKADGRIQIIQLNTVSDSSVKVRRSATMCVIDIIGGSEDHRREARLSRCFGQQRRVKERAQRI